MEANNINMYSNKACMVQIIIYEEQEECRNINIYVNKMCTVQIILPV